MDTAFVHCPLPHFSLFDPKRAENGLKAIIDTNRAQLQALLKEKQTQNWNDLILPLEEMDARLTQIWSVLQHLNFVTHSDAINEAYQNSIELLSQYGSEMGQNAQLYQKMAELLQGSHSSILNPEQQRLLENNLQLFRLSGIHLLEDQQVFLAALQQKLAELMFRFEENVRCSTEINYQLILDEQDLAGLPDSIRQLARQTAQQNGRAGYQFNLDESTYVAILQHACSRRLRETFFTAYHTRASDRDLHADQVDNSNVMEEIITTRQAIAKVLQFANFAEYALALKAVKDPKQILAFLTDLAERCKPKAQAEWLALKSFAYQQDNITDLQAWDIRYYREKLRQQQFNYDEESLRCYFPIEQVLVGLFTLVKNLFNLEIYEKAAVNTWHPDVHFYEIYDSEANLRGGFYLDLYERPNKRSDAWMEQYSTRRRLQEDNYQPPIVFLTCNFNPPQAGKPTLLSHHEVRMLFHEFGHTLHHIVSQVDYAGISGVNGVPGDALEIPSQFMEQWCWEKPVLQLIAKHYQTGETLSEVWIDRLNAAKYFQSASELLDRVITALFDLRIHLESPQGNHFIQRILDEVRQDYSVFPIASFDRSQHSLSLIFSGAYAAGYYSYPWAEMLACDLFARFEEEGFNPDTGRTFLQTYLEPGGSREPMALFTAFRGRTPQIEAMLRRRGILTVKERT